MVRERMKTPGITRQISMRKQILFNSYMRSVELRGQSASSSTCFDLHTERILWSLDGLERSGV